MQVEIPDDFIMPMVKALNHYAAFTTNPDRPEWFDPRYQAAADLLVQTLRKPVAHEDRQLSLFIQEQA